MEKLNSNGRLPTEYKDEESKDKITKEQNDENSNLKNVGFGFFQEQSAFLLIQSRQIQELNSKVNNLEKQLQNLFPLPEIPKPSESRSVLAIDFIDLRRDIVRRAIISDDPKIVEQEFQDLRQDFAKFMSKRYASTWVQILKSATLFVHGQEPRSV